MIYLDSGTTSILTTTVPLTRPTKDIDFLGRSAGAEADIFASIISDILKIACDDGVIFEPSSIAIRSIKEDADYEGLRAYIEGTLDSARKKLQIDIGFGDRITDGPVEMDYPVLLDQPTPFLLVYSKETAIAEKFEAMVRLGTTNSRMKDFYDILYLAENEEFSSQSLASAIVNTFSHRGTNLKQAEYIFSSEFMNNRQLNEMWTAFLKRAELNAVMHLPAVLKVLQNFLSIALEPNAKGIWLPSEKTWK